MFLKIWEVKENTSNLILRGGEEREGKIFIFFLCSLKHINILHTSKFKTRNVNLLEKW